MGSKVLCSFKKKGGKHTLQISLTSKLAASRELKGGIRSLSLLSFTESMSSSSSCCNASEDKIESNVNHHFF
jgi:hypothetical protein